MVVRQNNSFQTLFWYADTDEQPDQSLELVEGLHELTPYGMMLASLASCTAIVMHTYAQAHHIHLHEVELRASYDRTYRTDCTDCEDEAAFEEEIVLEILVVDDLSARDRKRLLRAAELCPIHKILQHGTSVDVKLLDPGTPPTPIEHDEQHHHHHDQHEHSSHE